MIRAVAMLALGVTISGRITGESGKHTVWVALWDEKTFLNGDPPRGARFDAGVAPAFSFEADAGRWALSAYEDENENGKLDVGMFGPKERSGFSVPFHKWRAPKFEDVVFTAVSDVPDAGVALH